MDKKCEVRGLQKGLARTPWLLCMASLEAESSLPARDFPSMLSCLCLVLAWLMLLTAALIGISGTALARGGPFVLLLAACESPYFPVPSPAQGMVLLCFKGQDCVSFAAASWSM